MTQKLENILTEHKDLSQILEITSGVICQPCWKASLSYGDELTLHLGERIPYAKKSMAGKEKGAWILGTRATAWIINLAGKTLVTSEDDPAIQRQQIKAIEGSIIVEFKISYPALNLIVTFSNELELILLPKTEEELDLPDWELFTPNQMVLKVGSGAKWCYTPSDGGGEGK